MKSLRICVAITLAGLVCSMLSSAPLRAQLVAPAEHPKFVNELPIPAEIDAGYYEGSYLEMEMREVVQWLGLVDSYGEPLMTTVWGYGPAGEMATYPGPTIEAKRDEPFRVRWSNMLPYYGFPEGPGAHLLPVDPTLHLAHPPDHGIPTVTHLHGGHTESASDGLPEAWFTQGFNETGPFFVKQTYLYDNDQEAGTLWYHDHALGITRLNVYAGLAGFYILRDANDQRLFKDGILPHRKYEVEIAIQDRMFADDGSLYLPSEDPEPEPGFDPLPDAPSIIAEFFGDYILVNGVTWPVLEVEPRKYRFRFLNGSDSRFYVLELRDDEMNGTAQMFYQIGTDNGFLPTPVALDRLLLAPGERADLVVDFSQFTMGTELFVRNFGPDDPFKGFNDDGSISDGEGGVAPAADPATTGKIMKFAVTKRFNPNFPDATVDENTQLRPDIEPLVQDGATRQLVLFEGLDNYGRLQPLLGTLEHGSQAWFEPITENPMLNDVEVWEVYNATEDAHPIHLHLVSFQILNRESFTGTVTERDQPQHDGTSGVGGVLGDVVLGGDARDPEANEMGWKDTAVMLPGEVTRVIARFDREGRYVWHCHILSHEDHEMMRPYYVGSMDKVLAGRDDSDGETGRAPMAPVLEGNHPNPFNPSTEISFRLPQPAEVDLKIFDARGRLVRTLVAGAYPEGQHTVVWDGRSDTGKAAPSGLYFSQMVAAGEVQSGKMLLAK